MEWHQRLLEELVYDQVKQHVDFLDLIDLERSLCESIACALEANGSEPGQEEAVAHTLIDRAFQRLQHEWQRERAATSLLCPLCEPLFECPSEADLRKRAAAGGE